MGTDQLISNPVGGAESGRRKPVRILVADDDESIRRLLEYSLRSAGYDPVVARHGGEAIALSGREFACALIDLKMPEADGLTVLRQLKAQHPDLPVIIISAVGQIREAVSAVKQGAFEFIAKPFELEELLAVVSSALQLGRALRENRELREAVSVPAPDESFVGISPAAERLRQTVRTIGPRDSTVLLTGESGVGKSLLARMIHRASLRAGKPFVTTSCPALPSELLESEMFGHERGAFTGAVNRRIGRFEMASGGTLFLDEIAELPLALQAKLLNVLHDRQFHRVGGSEQQTADIRLVAATNADLAEKVDRKEFRADLYYRINVIPLVIPPLRERIEDLPLLAEQVLAKGAAAEGREPLRLSPGALDAMSHYSWPGNIRELQNVLERASAFCGGSQIRPEDLPEEINRTPRTVVHPDPKHPVVPQLGGWALEDVERLCLEQTLVLCGGNKVAAARSLGVTEKTVYNKIARLGLR